MKKNRKRRPYLYAALFTLALCGATAYGLLDVFIIPHTLSAAGETATQTEVTATATMQTAAQSTYLAPEATDAAQTTPGATEQAAGQQAAATEEPSAPVVTGNSYSDENISINLETIRVSNTTVYVADITLASADYLKTALANDTYGTNITQTTSAMAAANGAVLAINGDYYGANRRGYVIKNGVLYRDSVRSDSSYDDLVIYADGSFGIINESAVSAQQLVADGVQQLLAFGPTLVQNGGISVSTTDEVDQSRTSNPRTAIGIVDELHYIIVVSDGRTGESEGLTLYELAQVMQQYGCTTAYNLDGGGSSTLYFNGEVINNPTTSGRNISERAVSDIVYIGY